MTINRTLSYKSSGLLLKSNACYDNAENDVDWYQKQVFALNNQLTETKDQLQQANFALAGSEKELSNATEQLNAHEEESRLLKRQYSSAHHRIQELEDQLEYEYNNVADDATSTSNFPPRKLSFQS